MKAKEFIDHLASDPELTLSFKKDGKPVWNWKPILTNAPIRGKRGIFFEPSKDLSSDELLIHILKENPGMELQLNNYFGRFPYMALYTNSKRSIKILDSMFKHGRYLCCKKRDSEETILLAEIRS